MIKVELPWIAEVMHGRLIYPKPEYAVPQHIERVTIDSRAVQPGDLFVAIEGPRFDGHDYVEQAIRDGAVAIVTQRPLSVDVAQIVVHDSRYALGQLGAAVKAQTKVKTIAMTGSSGKTTVKEMCAAILRLSGNVLATQGNFNNDIGVPLTLLNLTHEHDYAVIELGANHRGEIAYTTSLTKPDVALINNVSPAHVEGFGDIWGVARAKTEIAKGLPAQGVIYTNANSEFDEFWRQEYAARQHKLFALQNDQQRLPDDVHIYARDVQLDALGCATFTLCRGSETQSITLPIPGAHNVANAVAAAALCSELGVNLEQIAKGIGDLKPVPGRMNMRQVGDHVRIIDDTYNANVASAKAALDVLASFKGYRVMVLGDMGELGAHAREYHEEVGTHAIEAGIDNLFTLGVLSQSASQTFNGHGGQHFDNQDALLVALTDIMTQQQELTILVKGSRSARMERVVEALLNIAQQQHAGCTAC